VTAKRRSRKTKSSGQSGAAVPLPFLAEERLGSFGTWIPAVIALVYFAVMSYLTFRYHDIGGLGVETDFYVELVPQAKKLLAGAFSPHNYGAKGPVYSVFLAVFTLVFRDWFRAGLVLNIVSGTVFLFVAFRLFERVFNRVTAVLATFAVATNYVFLSYTYQAGSDLPFMALSALSIFFLFGSGGRRDLALSAVFGLLAFLTRYNGAFVVMGTVLYLALGTAGGGRDRLKRIGLWLAVFLAAGLPWFIPNWLATGNPVHNDNYMNVMLEFYGSGKDGVSYENWTDALPKEFTGLGDIVLYDPVYFAQRLLRNAAGHFLSDMKMLVGRGTGVFVVIGMLLFPFAGTGRKRPFFLAFGLFYFLILTLVFYNVRFSLFLLAVYLPFAVWPFISERLVKRLGNLTLVPLAAVALLTAVTAVTSTGAVYREIRDAPDYLRDLRDLGLALDSAEPDKTKTIIGRKPHVAYFAGLDARMFPQDIHSVPELTAWCRENGIDYILYSGIEAGARPHVRDLLNVGADHPGLEKVYHNRFGVIYRVKRE